MTRLPVTASSAGALGAPATSERGAACLGEVGMVAGASELIGAVLNGTWRLLALVGEGGLAAVYEAEGLQGQGSRAVKLLHPQFQSSPAVVDRFYNEAKAVYSLRHPNIAAVEAYAYAEDGSPYIVMELLRGQSVEEYLQQRQPMSPSAAIAVMRGVLAALAAAHAGGVIHRDLKPANLFLVARRPSAPDDPAVRAEPWIGKVLDFGIAKVMDLAGGMGSKTRTGALLGTPGYMSPEQVRDSKAVDARTDLWAAAVVLYEMLTCQHPFGSADHLARMVAVLKDPPRPITQVAPQLAYMQAFFDRALGKEPAQRFQTAGEMDAALAAFQQTNEAPPPATRTPGLARTEAIAVVPDFSAPAPRAAADRVAEPAPASAQPLPLVAHASVRQPSTPPQAGYAAPQAEPVRFSPVPPVSGTAREAAARQRPANTQVSGERPEGTPAYASIAPPVRVVSAIDTRRRMPVWIAAVACVACLALGVVIGYVLRAAL